MTIPLSLRIRAALASWWRRHVIADAPTDELSQLDRWDGRR